MLFQTAGMKSRTEPLRETFENSLKKKKKKDIGEHLQKKRRSFREASLKLRYKDDVARKANKGGIKSHLNTVKQLCGKLVADDCVSSDASDKQHDKL